MLTLVLLRTDGNSVFPSGMNTAMTWDAELMYKRGAAMGAEFAGKGVNVALGETDHRHCTFSNHHLG